MLFISPPFGNYFDFKHTTSIRGSFTLEPRTGLIGQIIKTLRYSYKHGGWVNKIGLRNKGLMWALEKYKNSDDIISIAILNENEIKPILKILPELSANTLLFQSFQIYFLNEVLKNQKPLTYYTVHKKYT